MVKTKTELNIGQPIRVARAALLHRTVATLAVHHPLSPGLVKNYLGSCQSRILPLPSLLQHPKLPLYLPHLLLPAGTAPVITAISSLLT